MDYLRQRVVSSFGLTPNQCHAALERERDIVVTAGAGSGKTRTLVARYASLLADGHSPRRVVAITFTEKAAREMRARVRQALTTLVQQAESDHERQRWIAFSAEMDSARIGTIHSLCTEILRAHPAEAGIDPKFDVLDEGLAAVLRNQIVKDILSALVDKPQFAPLFRTMQVKAIEDLLAFLLAHRLEAQETFEREIDDAGTIRLALVDCLQKAEIANGINELRSMSAAQLLADAGDKLAQQVHDLLELWDRAEAALAGGDAFGCAQFLYQARRNNMNKGLGGRNSQAKIITGDLQRAYDRYLNPWIGGKDASDPQPDAAVEEQFLQTLPLICAAYAQLSSAYQSALRQRSALDFDDLEFGAARLLQQPDVRARWQAEVEALLVDEFQDTNQRQQTIVEALAGNRGRLFIVGDARQSIYRFRRADVTVFRTVQTRIQQEGGLVIDLDETYRAHEPLLSTAGDVLKSVMGTADDPSRPYYVPFSPLQAVRKSAPPSLPGPHLELVLGCGSKAADARPAAAHALAVRLWELKDEGQIHSWDDVTLLMRASTGFVYYEDAFEEAGIPFVTVAGRGFYDRPEIRDVINILRALAEPTNDLAMAGLLRSPAFGLTDTALYQLRWQAAEPVSYWTALQGNLEMLDAADQARAARTFRIIQDLLPQVDRIPVFELLKKVVDATDYRSILAIDNGQGGSGRLWRNLDKLLADAQASGQVNVRDFLDYLTAINDVGAREGEAPAEAEGSVRLMTIHKSKGLEFRVVVLADASRRPNAGRELAYLSAKYGLAFKLETAPILFRIAKWEDSLQNDAEAQRLLYVALTRAQDKLIVSGHTTANSKGEWKLEGWLQDICASVELDITPLVQEAGAAVHARTSSGQPVRAWVIPAEPGGILRGVPAEIAAVPEPDRIPIYAPLVETAQPVEVEEDTPIPHSWRATGSIDHIPPGVIGQMVHKAIELWVFPGDSRLPPLLAAAALNAGLAEQMQQAAAVKQAVEYLALLQDHPLRKEIEDAAECYHEVPYSRTITGCSETGYMDLLYRSSAGWQIVDFKTDAIRTAAGRTRTVNLYLRQMKRYTSAVEALLGVKPRTRICFLDDHGRIGLVEV
jgi:ATP-dependent helicase/nuclease subunit A